MANLGERLKETRLKQGLTIQEIAGQTRIQPHFLEALEQNNLDVIPGAFFRKSFLRQYAAALGLNPDDFDSDTSIQFGSYGGSDDAPALGMSSRVQPDLPPLPTPGRTEGFPFRQALLSVGLLVGVVAVCAVAYTFWEDFQNRDQRASPQTQAPLLNETAQNPGGAEQTPANEAGSDASGSDTTPDQTASSNDPAALPGSSDTPGSSPAVNSPTNQTDAETKPTTPAEAPSTPELSVHGSGSRELRLSAKSLTWVRVREGTRTIYVGTIDVGQTKLIRVNEGAQILVGNAGGLNVVWQGSDIGQVGPSGQIRTVTLTPEGSSIQAPAPRTPSDNSGSDSTAQRG